jgi:2-phosphosulfolactate phosphatase
VTPRVRLDWGLAGALALVAEGPPAGRNGHVAVVVDVLSFTTTLTVAAERGFAVLPYRWAAAEAEQYAADHGALLARGRREGLQRGEVSLSPASFDDVAGLATGVGRVVLPSPNGSTIAFALADAGVQVVGACLRNAAAVSDWLAGVDGQVSVIAAGERWPDDSLRPAVEDLWGAGAVLAGLDLTDASPEARTAAAAYAGVRAELPASLAACESGRELVGAGFARDVEIAAAAGVSTVVPVMEGAAFVAADQPR